jgi:hypothetical protein
MLRHVYLNPDTICSFLYSIFTFYFYVHAVHIEKCMFIMYRHMHK